MAGRIESADPAAAKRMRLEALDILTAARTRDLAARPGDSDVYLARGTLHCRAGRFPDARADLEKAVTLDANNHWAWYRLACLRLFLGDEQAYRGAAEEMLRRFGSDPRRDVVERSAKVALLSPSPVGTAAEVSAMVERSLAPGAARSLVPWLATCKALAEYRAGRFDAAAEWAEKARAVDSFAGQATLDLLTAMAHQRAGRPEDARRWLRQAKERLRTQVPQPGADDLVASENYLVCEIIRREAVALIDGKAPRG
jgi:tetratricopeptide (TPR) repeat protein